MDQADEAVLEIIENRSNLARIFEEIRDTRRTTSGITVSPETSLECSAVLACVRVLSESIASLPMNLYRRLPGGGKEIAEDQHLHELLHYQTNDWMTAFEWKEWMMSQLLLWGNAYSKIIPGPNGAVDKLEPLHASRMTVKRLENGKLRYYYQVPPTLLNPNPDPVEYRQEQIFHIRWLSSDGVTGYVPVTLSREAIGLARAAEIHSSAFFGNNARGGAVFETDQPHKPEVLRRFKDQWNEMLQGPKSAFSTVVVPYGFKKRPEEINNATAQLLETRRFSVEECARIYRVPVHLLGDMSNVRYNTVEQSAIDFVTFSLIPWCTRIEMACRRDLVVDDKTFFVGFDLNALMAGDYEARAKHAREFFNMGALDVNELRQGIGLNPLPGEEGKKRFVQVNMALLEAFTAANPTGQKLTDLLKPEPAKEPAIPGEKPAEAAEDQAEPPAKEPAKRSAPDLFEVLFMTNVRRLAGLEIDGIFDRRGKPDKVVAWIDQMGERMKSELRDCAEATGRDIAEFSANWAARSREILLECQRSGQKYESVQSEWCDKHL
jgi:HK97 family phage portal protein